MAEDIENAWLFLYDTLHLSFIECFISTGKLFFIYLRYFHFLTY